MPSVRAVETSSRFVTFASPDLSAHDIRHLGWGEPFCTAARAEFSPRVDTGIPILVANANLIRTPVETTECIWTPGGLSAAFVGLFSQRTFSVVAPFLPDPKFRDFKEMESLQRSGKLDLPHHLFKAAITKEEYRNYYALMSNTVLWFWAHSIHPEDVHEMVHQCVDKRVIKEVAAVLRMMALDDRKTAEQVYDKLRDGGVQFLATSKGGNEVVPIEDILARNCPEDIQSVAARCTRGTEAWHHLSGLLLTAALDNNGTRSKVEGALRAAGIEVTATNRTPDLARGILESDAKTFKECRGMLGNYGITADDIKEEALCRQLATLSREQRNRLGLALQQGGVDIESIRRFNLAREIVAEEKNPRLSGVFQRLRANGVSLPQARLGDLATSIAERTSETQRTAIAYALKRVAGIDLEVLRRARVSRAFELSGDERVINVRDEIQNLAGINPDKIMSAEAQWYTPTSEMINDYRQVNQNFALECIEAYTKHPGLIWVQDYHLMLVREMIRRLQPDASIAYFHHIPFPAPDGERAPDGTRVSLWQGIPQPFAEEIVRGLLGADQLDFHTQQYKNNFIAAAQCVGAELSEDRGEQAVLLWDGRHITVGVHPISVDIPKIQRDALSEGALAEGNRFRALYGDHTALTITRADWTKGLLQEVEGWRRLAKEAKSDPKKDKLFSQYQLTFCLSVGRQDAPLFLLLKELLLAQITRVNIELQQAEHKPIVLNSSNLTTDQVYGYSGEAAITVDGSPADGYLLRIAETVAATAPDRDKNRGKHCLLGGPSPDGRWVGAGAFHSVGQWCVGVNGADPNGHRDGLWQAMDEIERDPQGTLAQLRRIRDYYQHHTVERWGERILAASRETINGRFGSDVGELSSFSVQMDGGKPRWSPGNS